MVELGSQSSAIEQSIRVNFHGVLLSRFKEAIKKYRLIDVGDKIAVCISGGKDSMLMAKLFQEYRKQSGVTFEMVYLMMNPGYTDENLERILKNSRIINIPLTVFETDIFASVNLQKSNPCFICSKMRRGSLYSKARELGCNKIALGHHFDDIIESTLMSMIFGGQIQTMLPRINSANFENMQLIRPMYLIREKDIISWCEFNGLDFIRCACRFTEKNTADNSARIKVKQLIAGLAEDNPQIEKNIFRSVENVNLKNLISYKDKNGVHSFLDEE